MLRTCFKVVHVLVKLFATLIEFTGKRKLEISGPKTVRELLNELDRMFPGGFKKELEQGYIILVNGKNIEHLQGLDTPLKEDDTVSIFRRREAVEVAIKFAPNKEYTFTLWDGKVIVKPKLDMKYLYVEITSRCNLKCEMCFKQYWEDTEGDMDWNLFLKILDDAEAFPPELRMIYFGGIGEPTVHPRFMDMVRDVKRRGFALGISTNGTLLTDEMMREFAKIGVDLIYFSMDTVPTLRTP